MDAEHWKRVEELFSQALGHAAAERAAFIERESGNDSALKAEVMSLLKHAGDKTDDLKAPLAAIAQSLIQRTMSTMEGRTLAEYQVGRCLGRGGMGEVYEALDLKLGRKVALKVLPEAFADEPARVLRLHREAKVIAALNHPQIASIHGVGQADGLSFLVLELVEGETLAARLARKPLAVSETLALARQLADALEAAHDRGVIHCDLKPANIAISKEDHLKVLDFGVARLSSLDAVESSADSSGADGTDDESFAFGTPAYMSPETINGRDADRRSDLWSFGCILFEMLSGSRAFSGADARETMSVVLTSDPDWAKLPVNTPVRVRRLLRRCLQKDRTKRIRNAGDAHLDLEDADLDEGEVPLPSPRHSAYLWPLALLAAVVLAAIAVLRPRVTDAFEPIRLSLSIPSPWEYYANASGGLSISPDGRRVAYVATDTVRRQLFIRNLGETTSNPLSETGGAVGPFFSPDGLWIGFAAENSLRKVRADGGVATVVCALSAPLRGASWGRDGAIYFSLSTPGGIYRVDAKGGTPVPVTHLEPPEMFHRTPQFNASGDLLFVSMPPLDNGVVFKQHADGSRTRILAGARDARVTSSGQLTFVRNGELFVTGDAAGTDASTARSVARNVMPTVGGSEYSFSETGTLLYVEGASGAPIMTPVWVTRAGGVLDTGIAPAPYDRLDLSPDGSRVALGTAGTEGRILIHDFKQKETRPFTVGDSINSPVWSSDGKSLAYRRVRTSQASGDVVMQPVDRSGEPRTLLTSREYLAPTSWSQDGALILESISGTFHVLDGQHPVQRIETTGGGLQSPRLSADGKWLAYVSTDGGTPRVYVQQFPSMTGRWLVSPDRGLSPHWSRDGRHMTFFDGSALMEVAVKTEGGFQVSRPTRLFDGDYSSEYVGAPDEERFLMLRRPPRESIRQLNIVLNWLARRTR